MLRLVVILNLSLLLPVRLCWSSESLSGEKLLFLLRDNSTNLLEGSPDPSSINRRVKLLLKKSTVLDRVLRVLDLSYSTPTIRALNFDLFKTSIVTLFSSLLRNNRVLHSLCAQNGVFSKNTIGAKLYALLEESATQDEPLLEEVCVFLLKCALFVDLKIDLVAQSLVENPEKITIRGNSGLTIFSHTLSLIEKANRLANSDEESNDVVKVCAMLLRNGADANVSHRQGITPLSFAVTNLNDRLCKLLLNYKANAYEKDELGNTLLHSIILTVVALHGSVKSAAQVCRLLIDHGLNVNEKNFKGDTPLHLAVRARYEEWLFVEDWLPIMEVLFDHGARVNETNEQGATPLFVALDSPRICQFLLKYGADVNVKNKYGTTPLLRAVEKNAVEICKALLEKGADPNGKDAHGYYPLHAVVYSCGDRMSSDVDESYLQEKICRLLLQYNAAINAKNPDGDTPLHSAVSRCNTRVTRHLLAKGAKKNETNERLQTPFHLACKVMPSRPWEAGAHKDIVEFLLLCRVKVTMRDIFGNLALHYWCEHWGTELDTFRDAGIAMNSKNSAGWTPLHIASFFNNVEGVKNLLMMRVDINERVTHSEKTALMIACECGHEEVCDLLLIDSSFKRDLQDKAGRTALDWACAFERVDLCRKLLHRGFSSQSVRKKVLLLQEACQNNNEELLELFFDTWDQWDLVDEKGNTVMHIACAEGLRDVVSALLRNLDVTKRGVSKPNKNGKTVLELAQGNAQILSMLSTFK